MDIARQRRRTDCGEARSAASRKLSDRVKRSRNLTMEKFFKKMKFSMVDQFYSYPESFLFSISGVNHPNLCSCFINLSSKSISCHNFFKELPFETDSKCLLGGNLCFSEGMKNLIVWCSGNHKLRKLESMILFDHRKYR